MKKILLFIIISIVTLSAPNPSNNQNSDKSVAELQFKIEQLEKRLENYEKVNWILERTQKDIEKLETKIDNREGLVYNVDQIYSSANDFYKTSFDDLKTLMYQASGLIVILLLGINYSNRNELKEKKEEIEKNIDKRLEIATICINEIVDAKTSELDDLKLKIEEMNKTLDKELLKLDNKTAEKIDILKLESEKAINYINNLSKEIKTALETEKERIANHESEIKEVTNQIEKLKKSTADTMEINNSLINNKSKFFGKVEQLFKEENYEEAIVILKENYIKSDYEINYWLGKNYQELKNYGEAIKYYLLARQYTELDEDKYRLNFDIGITYYYNKDYSNALKSFKIWNTNTNSPLEKDSAQLWIGIINYTLGNYADTVDILEKVKTPTKKYWLKLSSYEVAKKYYNKKNKIKALEFINKALKIDPNYKIGLDLKEKIENMPGSLESKTEE